MNYITFDEIQEIYSSVVKISGGGAQGIINQHIVISILEQIKNDDYYPEIEDKLTYLFFSLVTSHCFLDGNKRIALAICVDFLNKNGYLYILKYFLIEMENYTIHVASGVIKRDLLRKIIESIIYEDDFSEDLKLEIISKLS